MQRKDTLLYYARQIGLSVQEWIDTVHPRDRQTRFRELVSYHRQMGEVLEREANEQFRTLPRFGVHRAIIRESGKIDNTPKPE